MITPQTGRVQPKDTNGCGMSAEELYVKLTTIVTWKTQCPECGFHGASTHYEEFADGFKYMDISCPACGYNEVV